MTPWSVTFVDDAGDPRAPGLTLGHAFAIFSRQPTAHALALGIVVLAGLRVHVGDFGWVGFFADTEGNRVGVHARS